MVGARRAWGSRPRAELGHGSGTRGLGALWAPYGWDGGRHDRLASLSGASGKGDSYEEEWEGQEGLGEAMVGGSMRPEDFPRVNAALSHFPGSWRHWQEKAGTVAKEEVCRVPRGTWRPVQGLGGQVEGCRIVPRTGILQPLMPQPGPHCSHMLLLIGRTAAGERIRKVSAKYPSLKTCF